MRFSASMLAEPQGIESGGDPMSGDIGIQIAGDKTVAAGGEVPVHKTDGDVNDVLKEALTVSPNEPVKVNPADIKFRSGTPSQYQERSEVEARQKEVDKDNVAAEKLAEDNHNLITADGSGTSAAGDSGETGNRFGQPQVERESDDQWTMESIDMLKNNVLQRETKVQLIKEQAQDTLDQEEEASLSLDAEIADVQKQITAMEADNTALKGKVLVVTQKQVSHKAALTKLQDQFS